MADDASKLRQQIAFLSGLIKTHKKKPSTNTTEPQAMKPGQARASDKKTWSNASYKSQAISHIHGGSGLKQSARTSAYSLDRRTLNSHTAGKTKLNLNQQSNGLGGNQIPSASSLKWARKTENPQAEASEQQIGHHVQSDPKTRQQANVHPLPNPRVNLNFCVLQKQRRDQVASGTLVQSQIKTAQQLNAAALSMSKGSSNPYVLNKKSGTQVKNAKLIQSEVETSEKGSISSQSKANSNPYVLKKEKEDELTTRTTSIQPKKSEEEQKAKGLALSSVNSNPYILNKKEGIESKKHPKCVPNRTALHWRKPVVPVPLSTTGSSKSHSDSEIHTHRTRKDKSTNAPGIPLQRAVSQKKEISTVHAGWYKWEKPQQTTSKSSTTRARCKLAKGSRSNKLKWTSASQTSLTKNPYVLKKQTSKISNVVTVPTRRGSKSSVMGLPSKSQHVWRSKSLHKLDRRKRLSGGSTYVEHGKSQGSFMQRRKNVVLHEAMSAKPPVSRFSIVRSKPSTPIQAEKSNKVVFIGGVKYKSSANKLARAMDRRLPVTRRPSPVIAAPGRSTLMVHINGEKFVMDRTGKTLKRVARTGHAGEAAAAALVGDTSQSAERRRSFNKVVIRGVPFSQTAPGTLVRVKANVTQTLASRVLRRSVKTARVLKRKGQQKYCMFYNRFGKCNKGDQCPFIHDPSKVAVCTKFLRGTCKNTDGTCPFSHKVDPDKMPVCQFFLRGTCSNDSCPYSHVNVGKTAAVCEDFVAGYCPRGQKCKKKHILDCEDFKLTGTCPKGSKCRLVHRKRKERSAKRKSSAASAGGEQEEKRAKLDMSEREGFLPLSSADESTANSSGRRGESQGLSSVEPLPIRPRFPKLNDA